MAKLFKWLMLVLIPISCLCLSSCGDDDDEPKGGDDISTVGKLNTVIVSLYNGLYGPVTIDVGCTLYHCYDLYTNRLNVNGGKIAYAGDFNSLSSVETAPLLNSSLYSSFEYFNNDGGCYIVYSDTGNFIRIKVVCNPDGTETYTFQTYLPKNM